MPETKGSCDKGLTPECFKDHPEWAKMAFAYRLLCALAPPNITRRLQRYLLDAIFGPGFEIPPGWIFPPGVIFPPGWMPGDPLPPDFTLPPGFVWPPGWMPGDPLPPGFTWPFDSGFPPDWKPGDPWPLSLFFPPGTVLPPGFELPPGWKPGDPWPVESPFPPGVPPPPQDTGATPPLYVDPFPVGPINQPGRNSPPPVPVGVRLYGSLSNGYVVSRANNWPDAINGTGYLNAVTDEFSDGGAASAILVALQYYVKRAFLYFDLSSIPAGSKIKSAILGVVGAENAESSVRVYEGTQEDPLVETDFEAYTGYPFALASWQYYIHPDLNTNVITLSAGGRSYVKSAIGGTAKFCLREDTKDRANVAPVDAHPLNGMYWAKWPDTDFDPYLDLIYT